MTWDFPFVANFAHKIFRFQFPLNIVTKHQLWILAALVCFSAETVLQYYRYNILYSHLYEGINWELLQTT